MSDSATTASAPAAPAVQSPDADDFAFTGILLAAIERWRAHMVGSEHVNHASVCLEIDAAGRPTVKAWLSSLHLPDRSDSAHARARYEFILADSRAAFETGIAEILARPDLRYRAFSIYTSLDQLGRIETMHVEHAGARFSHLSWARDRLPRIANALAFARSGIEQPARHIVADRSYGFWRYFVQAPLHTNQGMLSTGCIKHPLENAKYALWCCIFSGFVTTGTIIGLSLKGETFQDNTPFDTALLAGLDASPNSGDRLIAAALAQGALDAAERDRRQAAQQAACAAYTAAMGR